MDRAVASDLNVILSRIFQSDINHNDTTAFFEEVKNNPELKGMLLKSVKKEFNVWVDGNGKFFVYVASKVVGRPVKEMSRILTEIHTQEMMKKNGKCNLVRFFESMYALDEGGKLPPNTPTRVYDEIVSSIKQAFRKIIEDLEPLDYLPTNQEVNEIYIDFPHFKKDREVFDATHMASCRALLKTEKKVEFATWDEEHFHKRGIKHKIRERYSIEVKYPNEYLLK